MMEIEEGSISIPVSAAVEELCAPTASANFLLLLVAPAWPLEFDWPAECAELCPEGEPETA
jgi:hypothetical protein